MAIDSQNIRNCESPSREAQPCAMKSVPSTVDLLDRVGKVRWASTKPGKVAVSAACQSSGDEPVKRQQIGQKGHPNVHVNLAERGAPRQRDGAKDAPS
jgi:hypothetical protein